MKKLIVAFVTSIISVTAYGQGAVVFNNFVPPDVNAKVSDSSGAGLQAGWTAQLWVAPGGTTDKSKFTALTPATTFRLTPAAAAGYIIPVDITVPGIAAGANASFIMRAFNGADFTSSSMKGESSIITIRLGGGTLPPSNLNGLQPFSVAKAELKPFVERQLPGGYSPGAKLIVGLQATPPTSANVYAVEDFPPASWTIGQISDGGLYDPVNKKVKFGPFFDHTARALTYEVTPPPGETGRKEFNGTASADGINAPIAGASTIELAPFHPADNNPADSRISIAEVTAYGAAWRKGASWVSGPNPIPIEYVTRAGTLWKNGEAYFIDTKVSAPPLWWVNVPAVRSAAVQARLKKVAPMATGNDGNAISALSPLYVPGEPTTVRLSIRPASQVSAYAAQDKIPAGWKVTQISDGGDFDAVNGQVKWGPFFDNNPRDLSYEILPSSQAEGTVEFVGFVSFDGSNLAIKGQRQARASHRLRSLTRSANGEFHLDVSGRVGGKLTVEGSSDLVTWTPVGTIVNANGKVSFKDAESDRKSLRFYRVQSE